MWAGLNAGHKVCVCHFTGGDGYSQGDDRPCRTGRLLSRRLSRLAAPCMIRGRFVDTGAYGPLALAENTDAGLLAPIATARAPHNVCSSGTWREDSPSVYPGGSPAGPLDGSHPGVDLPLNLGIPGWRNRPKVGSPGISQDFPTGFPVPLRHQNFPWFDFTKPNGSATETGPCLYRDVSYRTRPIS